MFEILLAIYLAGFTVYTVKYTLNVTVNDNRDEIIKQKAHGLLNFYLIITYVILRESILWFFPLIIDAVYKLNNKGDSK